MSLDLPVGQLWYDSSDDVVKMWDGSQWITTNTSPQVYTPDPYYIRAKFVKRFAFLPHKCHLSGRWIWMEWAIRGEENESGWAGSLSYYRWFDKGEHLIWMMKNLK